MRLLCWVDLVQVNQHTQKFITKHFQIPHVYTGDMMRSLAQQDTDIGRKVKSALSKGDYVDTQIVLDTLEARLQKKRYYERLCVRWFS